MQNNALTVLELEQVQETLDPALRPVSSSRAPRNLMRL